jgi:uncharacterized protein (DUF952 family)
MSEPIVHIAARGDWEDALASGRYVPPGFDQDGFVHCSFVEQVVPVADAFFAGRTDLVLLVIDRGKLSAEVRVEEPVPPTGSDDRFPHVYGPIEVDAVTDVVDLPCRPDGRFALPARLRS